MCVLILTETVHIQLFFKL